MTPAYDLLNTRIHTEDNDFTLNDGLLPLNQKTAKIVEQFTKPDSLARIAKNKLKEYCCNLKALG